jgi:hypothetical protein
MLTTDMNTHITSILDEARRAPSVLNSQPWRFRVCGNTIEVYLEKKPELEEVDPKGRLQVASCGTLIAHLEKAVLKRGWIPKVTFFPRFEESDLVAFVEMTGLSKDNRQKAGPPAQRKDVQENGYGEKTDNPDVIAFLQKKIAILAESKQVGLVVHDDSVDLSIQTYLKNQCGQKLDSDYFRKSVNLFLRTDDMHNKIPFEDEVLLSDRFFEAPQSDSGKNAGSNDNLFMILTTGTDNRFEWVRAGQLLGDIIIELRTWNNIGLMSLPIISADRCRAWLRDKLSLTGYPQFVLKMQPVKPREHIRKRPLNELLKYGF